MSSLIRDLRRIIAHNCGAITIPPCVAQLFWIVGGDWQTVRRAGRAPLATPWKVHPMEPPRNFPPEPGEISLDDWRERVLEQRDEARWVLAAERRARAAEEAKGVVLGLWSTPSSASGARREMPMPPSDGWNLRASLPRNELLPPRFVVKPGYYRGIQVPVVPDIPDKIGDGIKWGPIAPGDVMDYIIRLNQLLTRGEIRKEEFDEEVRKYWRYLPKDDPPRDVDIEIPPVENPPPSMP